MLIEDGHSIRRLIFGGPARPKHQGLAGACRLLGYRVACDPRPPDIAQGFFGLFSVFLQQNRIFLPKKHHLFLRISRARARLGPC